MTLIHAKKSEELSGQYDCLSDEWPTKANDEYFGDIDIVNRINPKKLLPKALKWPFFLFSTKTSEANCPKDRLKIIFEIIFNKQKNTKRQKTK